MPSSKPFVSFIIPTLNAASVLEPCLKSITSQDYPKKKIEIIIADGGSTDDTLTIAKKYAAKIVKNPLKTGEAGKAVGVKAARGDITAFIDSDNILPSSSWLKKMLIPFSDPQITASEPIKYTYRKKDPFLTRYFALLGMNDPICLFTGNYDRHCILTNKWTNLNFPSQNKKNYLKITLNKTSIPTIGANGFLIKRATLPPIGNYLFDIDILINLIKDHSSEVTRRGSSDGGIRPQGIHIAKVKTGIIHTFVEDSFLKFFKKQTRRINDMSYHQAQKNRSINWQQDFFWKVIYFQLQCLLIFPIIYQTLKGLTKSRDWCFLSHPIAVYSTLLIYLYNWVKGKINPAQSDRSNWKQ